jgi:hypothetical protein
MYSASLLHLDAIPTGWVSKISQLKMFLCFFFISGVELLYKITTDYTKILSVFSLCQIQRAVYPSWALLIKLSINNDFSLLLRTKG